MIEVSKKIIQIIPKSFTLILFVNVIINKIIYINVF